MTNPQYFRRAVHSLLSHDLGAALQALQTLAPHPQWAIRDAVVAGLSDILSPHPYQAGGMFSLPDLLGWPVDPSRFKSRLSGERILDLQAVYLSPRLWRPKSISEHKALYALQGAKKLLERILLYDADARVRASSLAVLGFLLDHEAHPTLEALLERAYQHEQTAFLRHTLAAYLGVGLSRARRLHDVR
jgi:HEAT repeat protein